MYNPNANKNKIDNAAETTAAGLVNQLIEQNRRARERSAQIISYYTNRPQERIGI